MTVKNYVLDINKTSLQHPSIVLRQDDYNIYTINVSVTDNGTPVDLGSYTLNFLGITPAGAKIIDSKNFITNAGDLKNGKFSYKFPKEAAGSKGVYDVAYFRLKTTSGATSTIDLNLRVLGGVDLTADDVKDYITVDNTLRNTLVSEVFKKVDATVDELKTQVQNSAVGTNLIIQSDLKNGYLDRNDGSGVPNGVNFYSDNYIATNGETVFTFSSPDYAFKGHMYHTLAMYDSDKNFLGYQTITSATQTLSKSNAAYIRFSISLTNEGGTSDKLSDWLNNHRYKLEKGNVATDWCPSPTEILTQSDYAKIQAAIVALGGSLS